GLRAAARKLLDTQRALDPILDRWRASGSSMETSTDPGDGSLAARLERLGTAMVRFEAAPSPEALRRLVGASWRLRLPERARRVLIESRDADDAVLTEAVRLAALDVVPATLMSLADGLEERRPEAPEAWLHLAALRYAGNDQPGMQRAIAVLEDSVGRAAMLRGFAGDPILGGLVDDTRFHGYLRQLDAAASEASVASDSARPAEARPAEARPAEARPAEARPAETTPPEEGP
ncbi:MAG: hypothetical protein AAGF23_06760, partial [Acidobacteriota bacterium]